MKPDNVLLSNRHALVTDFGIARAIAAASESMRMTSTGLAVGTPAYMAPEQAAGDHDVDARADIYSAGLVMYEMIAGHSPFAASSVRAMVTAQLTEDAAPPTPQDPSTPKALVALVMQCLAKNPADRPRSADAVLETLDPFTTASTVGAARKPRWARTVLAACAVIVVVGAAVGAWSARAGHLPFATPARPSNDTLRLTVFLTPGKYDPADANLGRTFSDQVLSELAKDPWLSVVTPHALTTGLQLIGFDPRSASRDTLIRYAKNAHTSAYIDLTVSHAGTGYVFSAEATGAKSDNSIGVESAAANSAADIPVAIERVAIALRRSLVRSRASLPHTSVAFFAKDVAAAAIPPYLEAESDLERFNYLEAAAKALEAVRLDSTFGSAWALRFAALNNAGEPISARLEAITAAHRLLGRDTSKTADHFMSAAEYLRFVGRDQEALAMFDSLMHIAPRNLGAANNAGITYSGLRKHDVAVRLFRTVIDTTYSRLSLANTNLVWDLLELGRVDEARSEYRRMLTHADSNDAEPIDARWSLASATRDWPAFEAIARYELAVKDQSAHERGLDDALAIALVRGQLARYDSLERQRELTFQAGDRASNRLNSALTTGKVLAMLGDTATGRKRIEEAQSAIPWRSLQVVDRPYVTMINALAAISDTTRATAVAAEWTREVPAEYKTRDSLGVLIARAHTAFARHNPRDAVRLLRLADVKGCAVCFYPAYARAFDDLGLPDSVLVYYEKYAAATAPDNVLGDGHELARAYLRLGEIYEERHDWKRASQRYQDFVNLWEHADASLQPAVKDVRARLERMRARAG